MKNLQNKCWGALGEIQWHHISVLLLSKSPDKQQGYSKISCERGSWALLLKPHLQSAMFWQTKTANWITETFATGENPMFFGIYSHPVQEGVPKLLNSPHYCIVPPLRRPVVISPHSSSIDILLETEALPSIFSTPPLLIVITFFSCFSIYGCCAL